MALPDLTNQRMKNIYGGFLQTGNVPISSSNFANVYDGKGNPSKLSISNSKIKIDGLAYPENSTSNGYFLKKDNNTQIIPTLPHSNLPKITTGNMFIGPQTIQVNDKGLVTDIVGIQDQQSNVYINYGDSKVTSTTYYDKPILISNQVVDQFSSRPDTGWASFNVPVQTLATVTRYSFVDNQLVPYSSLQYVTKNAPYKTCSYITINSARWPIEYTTLYGDRADAGQDIPKLPKGLKNLILYIKVYDPQSTIFTNSQNTPFYFSSVDYANINLWSKENTFKYNYLDKKVASFEANGSSQSEYQQSISHYNPSTLETNSTVMPFYSQKFKQNTAHYVGLQFKVKINPTSETKVGLDFESSKSFYEEKIGKFIKLTLIDSGLVDYKSLTNITINNQPSFDDQQEFFNESSFPFELYLLGYQSLGD